MDARGARARPVDGSLGRDGHQHRPAAGPGRPALLDRKPPVGRHGLRAGVRVAAPARWAPERPLGSAQRSLRGTRGLRPRLGAGRVCAQLRRARGRARGPGDLWGAARSRRARRAHRHVLRAQGTGEGLRHLRDHWGLGGGDRALTRRRLDPVGLVAMVPVHQHRLCRDRPRRRGGVRARRARGAPLAPRRSGDRPRERRALLGRLRIFERVELVMVEPGDLGIPARRRRAHDGLRRVAGAIETSAAAATHPR